MKERGGTKLSQKNTKSWIQSPKLLLCLIGVLSLVPILISVSFVFWETRRVALEEKYYAQLTNDVEFIREAATKNSDQNKEAVAQAYENMKLVYLDDSFPLNVRRDAGLAIAKQTWETYDPELVARHVFTGEKFADFAKSSDGRDVIFSIINLLEDTTQWFDLNTFAHFFRFDLMLEAALTHPDLSRAERENLVHAVFDRLDAEDYKRVDNAKNLFDQRTWGVFFRLKMNVLGKLDLLVQTEPDPLRSKWDRAFQQSIDSLIGVDEFKFKKAEIQTRIDYAHLLAELDGEKARDQIRQVLNPLFEPKNTDIKSYFVSLFGLANSSNHDLRFQKRGLQMLGKYDPRMQKMILEAGFPPSFFTDFELKIHSLKTQNSLP